MSANVTGLRDPEGGEEALEVVWGRSQQADDPGNNNVRGGWSLQAWATEAQALVKNGRVLGVAALRFDEDREVASGRLALDPASRTDDNAEKLVQTLLKLASLAGVPLLRLTVGKSAAWAQAAIQKASFERVRVIYRMLRPRGLKSPPARSVPGITVRAMRPGEEGLVLDALNRAWSDTWNYHPITREMLERDLEGQREGMLLGVDDQTDEIVATCHAIFDATDTNADGGPRAWISNLTADPRWRGRGLGRALLVAGLRSLYERGAQSIGLGVDGGNATPVNLYRSVGFEVISETDVWEKQLAPLS